MRYIATIYLAATAWTGTAAAQNVINEASITLDAAVIAADACEALATQRGWPVAIWVVDDNSVPVYMKRMQGAIPVGIDTALMKTNTSRVWMGTSDPNDPTGLVGRTFGDAFAIRMNESLDVFPVGGGEAITVGGPVFLGGTYIGAIGVGGAGAAEDAECAKASIAALQSEAGSSEEAP